MWTSPLKLHKECVLIDSKMMNKWISEIAMRLNQLTVKDLKNGDEDPVLCKIEEEIINEGYDGTEIRSVSKEIVRRLIPHNLGFVWVYDPSLGTSKGSYRHSMLFKFLCRTRILNSLTVRPEYGFELVRDHYVPRLDTWLGWAKESGELYTNDQNGKIVYKIWIVPDKTWSSGEIPMMTLWTLVPGVSVIWSTVYGKYRDSSRNLNKFKSPPRDALKYSIKYKDNGSAVVRRTDTLPLSLIEYSNRFLKTSGEGVGSDYCNIIIS